MLNKLIPEQISKLWDIIKYALEKSPPLPLHSNREDWTNRILSSALNGKVEIWISYTKGEKITIEGIAFTQFLIDEISNAKSYLIYYIYAYNKISKSSWVDGLETLSKYAKSRGCDRVVAYSNVPEVIEIAKSMGADVSITFISFNIEDLK